MDDPSFMLLQLQQNLQFLRTHDARVLTCLTHDNKNEPYWTYVVVTYDKHGNIEDYHDPYGGLSEWTKDPLEMLKQLHWKVAGFVANRLIHDCRPRLRSLAQQRSDEAPIKISGPPEDANQGLQSPISTNPSQPSSNSSHAQTFIDAQPYQSQKLGSAHFPQPSPVLGSEMWSPENTASRAKPANKQRLVDTRPHQPQKLGPAHFPQPSPLLGSETWPSATLPSRPKFSGSANKQQNHVFGVDGPSIHQQIQATGQRVQSVESAAKHSYNTFDDAELSMHSQAQATAQHDRPRSTKRKFGSEEMDKIPSAPQHAEESQGFHANTASNPPRRLDQQHQSRARRQLIGSDAKRREIPSRSAARRIEELSPWIRSMYSDPITSSFDSHNQSGLPEPLSSHPPGAQPISIMVDLETYNLQHTDPEEFRRRVRLAGLAMAEQARRDRDPIARIEYEAQEYLNDEPRPVLSDVENHDNFDGFFHAFSQGRNDRRTVGQTPPVNFPGSPESDKTVTPLNTSQKKDPIVRRRRSTHTHFDQENAESIPAASNSPPPPSQHTSRVPSYAAYPPTLSTSRSEAVMPRNVSTGNEAMRRNFSASNETMRRNSPVDNNEVSLGAHRPSQTQQFPGNQGERVHVQIQQGGDVFHRVGRMARVAGRKVSESFGGRRLGSMP